MPRQNDWEKQEADAIRKEYAPLAGATLVEVRPGRMRLSSVRSLRPPAQARYVRCGIEACHQHARLGPSRCRAAGI